MITKSAFLKGRQCPKRLWLWSQGIEEPHSEADEDLWDDREAEGAKVEALAEQLFENRERIGPAADDDEEVERRPNWSERVSATQRALQAGKTVVQAHLVHDDLLAIADIVEPRGDGWYLWEVKASTHDTEKKWKALYDFDLAFQVHVARQCGLKLVGAGVLLLDSHYVRPAGEIVPEDLIRREDRSAEVEAQLSLVEAELQSMREALRRDSAPVELPSSRCKTGRENKSGNRPSTCGHFGDTGVCGRELPEHWAGRLPFLGGKKAAAMTGTPNVSVLDLDADDKGSKWTALQERMIRAVHAGQPIVQHAELTSALDKVAELGWPVTYTDFEFDTGVAVPRHVGTRPYEKLPFQWAMVVQGEPGGELEERGPFLHLDGTDPRRAFAESFLAALPPSGAIIAHHKQAETDVLSSLAKSLGGELAARLDVACGRFLDTKVIATAGYYHPDQQGSYSIKKLAPAIIGRGYDDLALSDGMAAVVAWRRAIDPETDPEERERIREDLLKYCGRDAELMHEIIEELRRLSGWTPSA